MARHHSIKEGLAALLCQLAEEDLVKASYGSLDHMPRRRHWEGIADPLRNGYRRDAARILTHLRGKLDRLGYALDLEDETA